MRKVLRLFLFIIAVLPISFGASVKADAMPFFALSPKELVLRAEFSTDYSKSSAERKHNIELAVSSLNKTFIDANGEFSFNLTVGERSEKRGYKNAKIISKGEFTEGLGGGVCQVSTTVYNAFLLADLLILEYHPHSLAVSYVEPSFDAMVSYGYADLKAKNTTKNPMIIYASANGNTVTVKVYGERKDYVIERRSKVTGSIPAPYNIVTNGENGEEYPTPPEGEKMIVRYGKNGVKSEGYLVKKKNGKVIWKKRIRKDAYSPIPFFVVLGTKTER